MIVITLAESRIRSRCSVALYSHSVMTSLHTVLNHLTKGLGAIEKPLKIILCLTITCIKKYEK